MKLASCEAMAHIMEESLKEKEPSNSIPCLWLRLLELLRELIRYLISLFQMPNQRWCLCFVIVFQANFCKDYQIKVGNEPFERNIHLLYFFRYIGEVGDLIIGRIHTVDLKRWKVDIAGQRDAVLQLSAVNLPGGVQRMRTYEDQLSMRTLFCENDLVRYCYCYCYC